MRRIALARPGRGKLINQGAAAARQNLKEFQMTEHPPVCLREKEIAVLGERSEQTQEKLKTIEDKIDKLSESVAGLKAKAGVWGTIAGLFGAGIVTGIDWIKR